MKNLFLFLITFSLVASLQAQDENPYAMFGYEGKVLKTPQERKQHFMLLIPNTDTTSDISMLGIDPQLKRYFFFGRKGEVLLNDTLGQEDLAKFLSVDPLAKDYPWNSVYAFAENRVIDGIDLEGLEYYYTADGELIGNYG
ncbi:MAG: hypothetical protein AAF740_12980, partial [Bacteroidota bacterium]